MVEKQEVMNVIEQMMKENKQSQQVREKYVSTAQSLLRAADDLIAHGQLLKDLAQDIDPTLTIKKTRGSNKTDGKYTEAIKMCIAHVQVGGQIGMEHLNKMFPAFTDANRYYLLNTILPQQKWASVRTDGAKRFIYWDSVKSPSFDTN